MAGQKGRLVRLLLLGFVLFLILSEVEAKKRPSSRKKPSSRSPARNPSRNSSRNSSRGSSSRTSSPRTPTPSPPTPTPPTPTPPTSTPTSPTPTPTPTSTPTPTTTPKTPTPTPTASPRTPTPTTTASPRTPTPTPTASPRTPTPTPKTPTPSTPSATATSTPTRTASATPSRTPRLYSTEFYVSLDGDDSWSGTLKAPNVDRTDGPFATLLRARDALRRQPPGKAYQVYIRKGTYFLNETFNLVGSDSGEPDLPITYRNYENEQVVISGGVLVTTPWFPLFPGSFIWYTDLPNVQFTNGYPGSLYVDGARAIRARYPNQDYLYWPPGRQTAPGSRSDSSLVIRQQDFVSVQKLTQVDLILFHTWKTSLHHISSYDPSSGLIRFSNPTEVPIGGFFDDASGNRYYFENAFEFLDMQNEWYYDRDIKRLYYHSSTTSFDPRNHEFILSNLNEILRLQSVNYVNFVGLSFQHSGYRCNLTQICDYQAVDYQEEAAIHLIRSNNNQFLQNKLRHVDSYAIWIDTSSSFNVVDRSEFRDLGTGGVRLGSSKANQLVGNNVISNNLITDGGHVFAGGVGVFVALSSYNTVTYNEISYFSYTGVSVGIKGLFRDKTKLQCDGNRITNNLVHHVGLRTLSDMGCLYTKGATETYIGYNVCHDLQTYRKDFVGACLYADQASVSGTFEFNLCYKMSGSIFHQNFAIGMKYINNFGIFGGENGITFGMYSNPFYESEPSDFIFERNVLYANKGKLMEGNFQPSTNPRRQYTINNNLYYVKDQASLDTPVGSFQSWQQTGYDVNSIVADPLFLNLLGEDFTLLVASPALSLGIISIRVDVGIS